MRLKLFFKAVFINWKELMHAIHSQPVKCEKANKEKWIVYHAYIANLQWYFDCVWSENKGVNNTISQEHEQTYAY